MTGDILMIESSAKNDKGMFICRASNVYGYEEVSLTVDVHCKLQKKLFNLNILAMKLAEQPGHENSLIAQLAMKLAEQSGHSGIILDVNTLCWLVVWRSVTFSSVGRAITISTKDMWFYLSLGRCNGGGLSLYHFANLYQVRHFFRLGTPVFKNLSASGRGLNILAVPSIVTDIDSLQYLH